MIFKSLLALASVGFFVILAEIIRRQTKLKQEFTRKIAHIGSAVMISIWPFYLSWSYVQLLALALLVGVVLSQKLSIFGSIHDVKRKSYGEPLFALAILGVGFLAISPAIFCVAILHMGLADGLAAVTGTLWGKKSSYDVLGDKKSIVGTATFFVTSLLIMTSYAIWATNPVSVAAFISIIILTTAAENISRSGSDNVTVPMLVVIILGSV